MYKAAIAGQLRLYTPIFPDHSPTCYNFSPLKIDFQYISKYYAAYFFVKQMFKLVTCLIPCYICKSLWLNEL